MNPEKAKEHLLSLIGRCILACLIVLGISAQALAKESYYVIRLAQYTPGEAEIKSSMFDMQPFQAYAEFAEVSKRWRINVGFFGSAESARDMAMSLHGEYPKLKVIEMREQEFLAVQNKLAEPSAALVGDTEVIVPLGSRQQIDQQLKRAAGLYRQRNYSQAASLYQLLSQAPDSDQASWALELYGLCLEKQQSYGDAIAVYSTWLASYGDSASEARVSQRLLALNTAIAEPQPERRKTSRKSSYNSVYGSTSLVYRGFRRKINDQDAETPVSTVQANLDLHIRARAGNMLLRSRVNGGYFNNFSGRQDSDGYLSNLYLNAAHEPTGAEISLGRQRTNQHGIYGYLDGLTASYPITGKLGLSVVGGSVALNSRESPVSKRRVYGLGAELGFANPGMQLNLYGVEQSYEGITERRALGGEFSYFNDNAHYLLIADYDIEFNEANNLLFNGSWNLGKATNLALSLGYQRSPFLTATNALIGEYDTSLDEFMAELDDGTDIYDAALEKTAISRYASLMVNQQLSERLRLIGEIYRYQLSDLPVYDPMFDTPTSDANTTFGLQTVLSNAMFKNDYLSTGARYTQGDSSNVASIFVDEKLRFNTQINLILRVQASRRWVDETEAHTLRPGVRMEWYFTPTFLLDSELGYEWLSQEFNSQRYKARQGFLVMGLRKRF